MGTQLDNFKNAFSSKSKLATWAVTPAVIAGLALVGYQTYNLISGRGFGNFDFGVGKLWNTTEQVANDKPMSILQKVYESHLERNSGETNLYNSTNPRSLRNTVVKATPQRITKLMQPHNETAASPLHYSLLSNNLDALKHIDVESFMQGKQMIKYFNRLENEYLINPKLTPEHGNWYFGFSISPTLNYRTFGYDASSISGITQSGNTRYTYGMTENDRNSSDRSITSYTMGIDLGKRINSRFSIYTGLYYANYGEQIFVKTAEKSNPNYSEAKFLNKSPSYELYSKEDNSENLPYTNKYYYIEIPLGLRLDLLSKQKFTLSADLGINLQKLDHVSALVYDFETDYYYWVNKKENIFRDYGIGTVVGVTFSQFVGEQLELFVNPQFKYTLNSTFKKPYPVSQNQYNSGLRVGFKRHIN